MSDLDKKPSSKRDLKRRLKKLVSPKRNVKLNSSVSVKRS